MHLSTISRVVNEKYVQTSYGCYSLKHFFSSQITNDSGESISSKKIKAILKQVINEEDTKKPLSDETLSKILYTKKIKVARRTVAKYREQLNISNARLRKKF